MRLYFLICCLITSLASAAEPLATVHEYGVSVTISLENVGEGRAMLVGSFSLDSQDPPLHLYDLNLSGQDGGVPTQIQLAPGSTARALGPLTTDAVAHDLNGLAVYPPGPVTLKLPIALPEGEDGEAVDVGVIIRYMACTELLCNRPQTGKTLQVKMPTAPRSGAIPMPSIDPEVVRSIVREELVTEREALSKDLDRRFADLQTEGRIRFAHPKTVAEVDTLIQRAHDDGRAAILDFTGPSCTVCQQMARTVLRDAVVIKAWNQTLAIEIDTDTYSELADWQTSRFHTQSRPLYVRIAPDGSEQRWSQVFATSDTETMKTFLAWTSGGAGVDVVSGGSWWSFLLLAIGGGLFTLVMPCTYPMIPFTVNFFAKQAASGHRLLPLALFYAGGIVVCFVGIGAILAGVLQANPAQLSGNPWTNLVFTAVFMILGFSLIGAFILQVPSSLQSSLGGGRSGYVGALLMGATFVVTAFACTAPFAGVVLGGIASDGSADAWLRMIVGMGVYGATIGIPFFILAMSPGLLTRLPKAGSWMNEFKVVGGLVEIAAAFKFLNIADHAWQWGFFSRSVVFSIWAVICAMIAAYVLGQWRTSSDGPVEHVGAGRLVLGLVFAVLALWVAGGVFGNDLGRLESFLAPEI